MGKSFLLKLFVAAALISTKVFAWSPPIDITTPGYTTEQSVAVDPSGNAMIVFINSNDGSTYTAQASQLINGVPTTPHIFALREYSQNASNPNVAVNASGDAVAVWVEYNLETYVVVASRFINGSWEEPEILSDFSGDVDSTPGVVLDDTGTATVGWLQRLAGIYEIVVRRRPLLSTWQVEELLVSTMDYLLNFELVGAPSGICLGAWENEGNASVVTAYFNGTSWAVANIPGNDLTTNCGLGPVGVSMNRDGNAALIWQNDSGSLSSVRILNGVIGSVQTIPTVANPFYPNIGIDAANNAVAIWVENDEVDNIQSARLIDGVWTAPFELFQASATDINLEYTEVAVQASGDAVATWVYYDIELSTSEVVAVELKNGVWGEPAIVSLISPVSVEYLAMNAEGYAVIVWNNGVSPEIILEAVFRTGSSLLPPADLKGVQLRNKFLTQTEYQNTLSWQASESLSVVKYYIYRDGKFIGSVPATSALVYSDHNRKKGQRYTYTVTGVNSSGSQSSGISIVL